MQIIRSIVLRWYTGYGIFNEHNTFSIQYEDTVVTPWYFVMKLRHVDVADEWSTTLMETVDDKKKFGYDDYCWVIVWMRLEILATHYISICCFKKEKEHPKVKRGHNSGAVWVN